jgi:3'(2'), 5'-bisphosphate nucleotidase
MNEILSSVDLEQVNSLAVKAGKLIMEHYNHSETKINFKKDKSPVTDADIESSELIIKELKKITPDVPVVSEEQRYEKNLGIMLDNKMFWLIDPIDGTWSFIKKRGIFTVNIALIKDGVAIYGDIYSPLEDINYYSDVNGFAFKEEFGIIVQIQSNKQFTAGYDFLVSHQNFSQNVQNFIDGYPIKTITPIPSSIKFALIARGSGDIYPRFKPTCIWDTAAGHAILKAAGGEVFDLKNNELIYDKNIINPSFIAVASRKIDLKSSG